MAPVQYPVCSSLPWLLRSQCGVERGHQGCFAEWLEQAFRRASREQL
jgi:hypothetical protein